MKEIALTRGRVTLVDDDLYDWLNQWKWRLVAGVRTSYAARTDCSGGGRLNVIMHRLIMDAPPNMEVDHIDHNGLNNQKSNLRLCTTSQNQRNKRAALKGASKYLGVCVTQVSHKNKDGVTNSWAYYGADIGYDGNVDRIGYFKNETDAAMAYDIMAIKHHGEFANLNFPELIDEYKSRGEDFIASKRRKRASMYRGVRWMANGERWFGLICHNKKSYRLGTFDTEVEAALSYDRAAVELYGDAAKLNFPEKKEEYLQILEKKSVSVG